MKLFSKRNIIIVVIINRRRLWFYRYRQSHQPVSYDTVKVMRGNLAQTVEGGKIIG